MAQSQARRTKRQMARDIKKNGRMFNLPTEDDVQEYINNKIKELNNEGSNSLHSEGRELLSTGVDQLQP
jgi:hypothetical protein